MFPAIRRGKSQQAGAANRLPAPSRERNEESDVNPEDGAALPVAGPKTLVGQK
jgi:hypothetical protein